MFDGLYRDVVKKFPEVEILALDSGYKTPWIMKQIFYSNSFFPRHASLPGSVPVVFYRCVCVILFIANRYLPLLFLGSSLTVQQVFPVRNSFFTFCNTSIVILQERVEFKSSFS